ncbi:hypothetical protein V6x_04370 [Gimesia chilikensis]|uniref:Uncharacterized protein n=1 Tax=Gimesia chilikensis TaxID=2605989 RepID=A0A517W687_9PLAN|nr:hypothetical protein V6x_04370 [Gimesia chilikensis]
MGWICSDITYFNNCVNLNSIVFSQIIQTVSGLDASECECAGAANMAADLNHARLSGSKPDMSIFGCNSLSVDIFCS